MACLTLLNLESWLILPGRMTKVTVILRLTKRPV